MGNLARIKKAFLASEMDVRTKRRMFRGKKGKKNRDRLRGCQLLAMPTHEKEKKADVKETSNQELPESKKVDD